LTLSAEPPILDYRPPERPQPWHALKRVLAGCAGLPLAGFGLISLTAAMKMLFMVMDDANQFFKSETIGQIAIGVVVGLTMFFVGFCWTGYALRRPK
jgi:hypothetical protein